MTLVVEDFAVDSDSITRIVSVGKRRSASVIRATQLKQTLENQAMGSERLLWELLELRGYVPQRMDEPSSRVGIVDLCCGCGGLSLGAKRAVEALGLEARFVAAADVDATALAVHSSNFATERTLHTNIEDLVDYQISGHREEADFAYPPEMLDDRTRRIAPQIIYDLPEDERPDCHKGGHTYPSVYGRMRPGEPAQTITTGFTSPGRGRFIHPVQRRTITPHEAARLQSFPDYFHFETSTHGELSRSDYAKLIGDAVPPRLGYVAALCMLAGYLGD